MSILLHQVQRVLSTVHWSKKDPKAKTSAELERQCKLSISLRRWLRRYAGHRTSQAVFRLTV